MRTLFEILDAVATNAPATETELRYALQVMTNLVALDRMDMRNENKRHASVVWGESFRRHKRALAQEPTAYLGWDNDPENPEYQRRRQTSLRLAEMVMK